MYITHKEQVNGSSGIRKILILSVLQPYIAPHLWPGLRDDDKYLCGLTLGGASRENGNAKAIPQNAGQPAQKIGESLTKPWHALSIKNQLLI